MVKLDRTNNALKGTISGIVVQLFNMLMPFVIRTLFIHSFGIEYVGLNSLFVSILQVLNLAELGVGSALVFSMYEPISCNNKKKICALMRLYKIYYRIIGFIVLSVGLLLIPFLPKLISGEIPNGINLYIVYLLNLIATVLSYWMFAYRNSLLVAYQKNYIINIITLITNFIKYILQLIVLLFLENYYLFLIAVIISQIFQNIVTAIVALKKFPDLVSIGSVSKTERKKIDSKVLNLFAAKICGVVTNSADSMVISAILGLTILGIYNNYYYILTSVMAMVAVLFNSLRAGIGNALITENPEKNISDFNKLTCIVSFIICVCFSCFLNLFQPFITLWVGEENLLSRFSVILLCLYFMFYEYPIFWAMYKDAAGRWKEDRRRSIVAPIFNLFTNIVLVKYIGLNGVLISTIVTYAFISGPWLLIIIKKYVINYDVKKYLLMLSFYSGCVFISAAASFGICENIHVRGVLGLIMKLVISISISVSIFFILFWRTTDFKHIYQFILHHLKIK